MPTATAPKFLQGSPLAASRVDREAGVIRDAAIVSIGEALGHQQRVDAKSLSMLFELSQQSAWQSFVLHSWEHPPTESIGLFSGVYIDAAAGVLRGTFSALKAFMEHCRADFDTLMEMAEKAPETFGLSIDFDLDSVWTMSDGSEVEAVPVDDTDTSGHRWKAKPLGATADEFPVVRPTKVRSVDFVQEPAANKALFSAIDKPRKTLQQSHIDIETQSHKQPTKKPTFSVKAIYARFKDSPKALHRAVQLAAETPDAKEDEIIAKVEEEVEDEEYKALVAERDGLKAKVGELEAKLAELQPKAEKSDQLSKDVDSLKTQMAQLSKSRGRFGAAPVNTGAPGGKGPATITRAQFDAMPHPDRNAHMAAGGKVVDQPA